MSDAPLRLQDIQRELGVDYPAALHLEQTQNTAAIVAWVRKHRARYTRDRLREVEDELHNMAKDRAACADPMTQRHQAEAIRDSLRVVEEMRARVVGE